MRRTTSRASDRAWETVIGLEIHCRLATASKLFCGAANRYGAAANTQTSAVDLGLPGALPVVNHNAIEMAVRFGLAINADIAEHCWFARKNYFYPDLPKGYQISQFDAPIVGPGMLTIELDGGGEKTIQITRAHLEEDAGKSIHEGFAGNTGIDLNRAGTPLIEIVSEPDMRTAQEAVTYMKKIHSLVRYLGICDGNMQEGSFRCDANVSVRRLGEVALGTRAELKNINSFRFVALAIHHEVRRQIDVLEEGGAVVQETRLYDPAKNETRGMRDKEESHDYRYFPDPDLPPVRIDPTWVDTLRETLPELPDAKKQRLIHEHGLSEYDSAALSAELAVANYFESCVGAGAPAKLAANWIKGELTAAMNQAALTIQDCPVAAGDLAEMLQRVADNTLSNNTAKQVFEALWEGDGDVERIIERRGLRQISDENVLRTMVDEVLRRHPEQLARYQAAVPEKQKKILGFFVGKVMHSSGGKANPQHVNRLLREQINDEGKADTPP